MKKTVSYFLQTQCKLKFQNYLIGLESEKNTRLLSIFSIALLSVILITSQSNSAFAGFIDKDDDGFQNLHRECTESDILCDPDDNDACNPDPSVDACKDQITKAVNEIGNLMDDVQELIDEGDFDINNGQTNALFDKLEKAIEKLESDKLKTAINLLNAFGNMINAHINSGSISSEDGEEIIETLEDIISELEED